eukprot:scaffold57785_cov47-Prasinocladus_malaysianus.AAC.1
MPLTTACGASLCVGLLGRHKPSYISSIKVHSLTLGDIPCDIQKAELCFNFEAVIFHGRQLVESSLERAVIIKYCVQGNMPMISQSSASSQLKVVEHPKLYS